jgi:hypothetical protein
MSAEKSDLAATPAWALNGTVLISCNCDYGCPCNFNALPSRGHCEGGWTWVVETGSFGDTRLDGLAFSLYAKWPGAIHEGNGEAVILIDDRADARQQDAIMTLMGGTVGGPWGVLAWTWPTVHGPRRVRYDVDLQGRATRVRAGDAAVIESTTIRNPVSGAEVHPSVDLPEGIVVKRADLGCSSVFRVAGEVAMDHSGQYTAIGAFEYRSA